VNAEIDRGTLATAKQRRPWRVVLMLSVPLLLAALGLYLWLTGGQSVSTDNAYVQQSKVSISSDVTGRVITVGPAENSQVKRGDVLIRIAPRPFEIALAEAEARVAAARLQARERTSDTSGADADVAGKREAVAFARTELARQQKLMADGFTTRARLEAVQFALAKAEAELNSALADAGGTHPLVLAAMAARDQAAFELSRTTIKAPGNGIITQTEKVLPGQVIVAGVPTMTLMLNDHRWVEANFKETDLEHMKVGQRALVTLDAWPGQPLEGRVESIGAGTGSEFSVLPAQNATGNWVKVVQRVPVRISLPADARVPLIAGLSATVKVDTPH
jgi:membrane fusion protein (multidrug efflux system)